MHNFDPKKSQKEYFIKNEALSECKVLIVDDEEISRIIFSTMLEDMVQCTTEGESSRVMETCQQLQPDLILLDVNMPGKDGITLCNELKHCAETSDIPVLFITGSDDADSQIACWEAGASDFVAKPVIAATLLHRVKNLLLSEMRLKLLSELTVRDPLTTLYNRYYLDNEVPKMFKHVVREQQHFGVIMIDIDHFKGFNDTYGHVDGDLCLQRVAAALRDCLRRPQDCIVRYGGEEFAIFLPNTNVEGCQHVGNVLVKAVESLSIPNVTSPYDIVTVSAGYAVTRPNKKSLLKNIIGEADLSLYESKKAGENQVSGRQL